MIAKILGRAWIFDEDPFTEIDLWEHEFEPMVNGEPCDGTDWFDYHWKANYTHEDIRRLLGVPSVGNFQVMFKGTLSDNEVNDYGDFVLEESKFKPMPQAFVDYILRG